ncbi:regulator of microtubule dynamics protein 1-like [Physella acuta]|uniref:regulator of microtubule dynamics protein 1-like n=1 Tax=Physella acuta TaxID=109671 RepID=UPI0027DB67AE|nr:regulator of microtubule dynamics protein 1-like [Physella acuta]XP_059140348.1 regulator of microtubule dynamics protein 1-like [Physella acuta]XP_059140349.1 regulator of microtubule dynamics protein 1-like [Physella acuta]
MGVGSKALIASGIVLVGSGLAYLAYQQYNMLKRESELEDRIERLSREISRLENELKRVKSSVVLSSSTEDNEDVYVDASEVAQNLGCERYHNDCCSGYQSKTELLAEKIRTIDCKMEAGGLDNLTEAYNELCEMTCKDPNNAELMWRFARAGFLLITEEMLADKANCDKSNSSYRDVMKRSHEAAARAIELNPKSGDSHKWMAIIVGSVTQYLPVQEQIKNAYVIKDHIDTAIKYKPDDALLYHMLGRWCYSVYMLTWVERKVASTLFATPPTAKIEEALQYFLKAEELSPLGSLDNALYLAKTYIAMKNNEKAAEWLRIGSKLPCSPSDEVKSADEIKILLPQYEMYANT